MDDDSCLLLGDDGLLDLAALNVENRNRGFALRVDIIGGMKQSVMRGA
jgi:hypothetical protein